MVIKELSAKMRIPWIIPRRPIINAMMGKVSIAANSLRSVSASFKLRNTKMKIIMKTMPSVVALVVPINR